MPSTDGVVNRAEVRVIGTVVRVPESVQKRYGIFTTTRSFGCVSVPNGEPPIGESNPVEALVEALMVKTEMSPPTLLVTSRNFPDGSITTLEGALFAVKGEPVIGKFAIGRHRKPLRISTYSNRRAGDRSERACAGIHRERRDLIIGVCRSAQTYIQKFACGITRHT